MAQLLRVLAASPKDGGSILSTHMASHNYLIDYSCRGSDTLFWPPQAQDVYIIHMQVKHTQDKEIIKSYF